MLTRFKDASLRFQEKTTAHLRALFGHSPAISAIYTYDKSAEVFFVNTSRDILHEKKYSPIKGVIQKFPGRIVVLLTYTCAAYCRYCERQDRVGVGLDATGHLRADDIMEIASFIKARPEINEIVLSGGDPLMNPRGLKLLAGLLASIDHVKILRIHTRLPLQQPRLVKLDLLAEVSSLFPTCYFSIHIDHPDELTSEIEDLLIKIRRTGLIMLAQSVFLKGINDDAEILKALFAKLAELGIRPYYIYHCQAIPATMRFVVPLADEVRIMTKLREHLSGIAFPQHVIDLPHARGKVVVPTAHWETDFSEVSDFDGKRFSVGRHIMQPLEQ
jgi:lysine 2,3-aminomutase